MFQTKGILGNHLKVQKKTEKKIQGQLVERSRMETRWLWNAKPGEQGPNFLNSWPKKKKKEKTQKLKDIRTAKIGIKKKK